MAEIEGAMTDIDEEKSYTNLVDSENVTFGEDYFWLEDRFKHVKTTDHLGDEWVEHIAFEPIDIPQYMVIFLNNVSSKPPHRCTGFANLSSRDAPQRRHRCGNNLMAILTMYLVKDGPGLSMSFESTTFLYKGSASLTAYDLLALGVDVIVASYDQVEAAQRGPTNLPDRLDRYLCDRIGLVTWPRRPIAALYSAFWRMIDRPIKS
ncbi:hypothetical protein P885DRAFT_60074 [Corynascus similis CBS 632.67]